MPFFSAATLFIAPPLQFHVHDIYKQKEDLIMDSRSLIQHNPTRIFDVLTNRMLYANFLLKKSANVQKNQNASSLPTNQSHIPSKY